MLFKWILAFHIIAVVAWFAGLFYLPRLYVYHSQVQAEESKSLERFQTMEYKLYYYITWPAALLASTLGLVLLSFRWEYYSHLNWMHIKLVSVIVLWGFHLSLGHFLKKFRSKKLPHTEKFFRIYNEVPTVLLFVIIIAAVVQPFSG